MSDYVGLPEPEFRKVPEFDYEVSEFGDVRSLERVVIRSNGRPYTAKAKSLRPIIIGGYSRFALYRDGERVTASAHRLVLEAFVGPPPTPDHKALHRDDDPQNNHVSNLYWGTMQENAQDRVRNGGDANARKTHCKRKHLLEGPNLAPWGRENHRTCLACNRALTLSGFRGRAGDEPYIAEIADQKYEEIMAGAVA